MNLDEISAASGDASAASGRPELVGRLSVGETGHENASRLAIDGLQAAVGTTLSGLVAEGRADEPLPLANDVLTGAKIPTATLRHLVTHFCQRPRSFGNMPPALAGETVTREQRRSGKSGLKKLQQIMPAFQAGYDRLFADMPDEITHEDCEAFMQRLEAYQRTIRAQLTGKNAMVCVFIENVFRYERQEIMRRAESEFKKSGSTRVSAPEETVSLDVEQEPVVPREGVREHLRALGFEDKDAIQIEPPLFANSLAPAARTEGARKAIRKPFHEAVQRIHRAFDAFVDEMPDEMSFVDCLALAQRIREYAETVDRVLGEKLQAFVTSMRSGMRQRADMLEKNAHVWFSIPADGQDVAARAVKRFPARATVQVVELLQFIESLGPAGSGGAYLSQYAGTSPAERVRADALPSPQIQILNRAIVRIADSLTANIQGGVSNLSIDVCRAILEENGRTTPTLTDLLAGSGIPAHIIAIFDRSIIAQRAQMLLRLPELFGEDAESSEVSPASPTISRGVFSAIVRDVGQVFINVSAGGGTGMDLSGPDREKKREALRMFHTARQAFAHARDQRLAALSDRVTLEHCLQFVQSLDAEQPNFGSGTSVEMQRVVAEMLSESSIPERVEMERQTRELFGRVGSAVSAEAVLVPPVPKTMHADEVRGLYNRFHNAGLPAPGSALDRITEQLKKKPEIVARYVQWDRRLVDEINAWPRRFPDQQMTSEQCLEFIEFWRARVRTGGSVYRGTQLAGLWPVLLVRALQGCDELEDAVRAKFRGEPLLTCAEAATPLLADAERWQTRTSPETSLKTSIDDPDEWRALAAHALEPVTRFVTHWDGIVSLHSDNRDIMRALPKIVLAVSKRINSVSCPITDWSQVQECAAYLRQDADAAFRVLGERPPVPVLRKLFDASVESLELVARRDYALSGAQPYPTAPSGAPLLRRLELMELLMPVCRRLEQNILEVCGKHHINGSRLTHSIQMSLILHASTVPAEIRRFEDIGDFLVLPPKLFLHVMQDVGARTPAQREIDTLVGTRVLQEMRMLAATLGTRFCETRAPGMIGSDLFPEPAQGELDHTQPAEKVRELFIAEFLWFRTNMWEGPVSSSALEALGDVMDIPDRSFSSDPVKMSEVRVLRAMMLEELEQRRQYLTDQPDAEAYILLVEQAARYAFAAIGCDRTPAAHAQARALFIAAPDAGQVIDTIKITSSEPDPDPSLTVDGQRVVDELQYRSMYTGFVDLGRRVDGAAITPGCRAAIHETLGRIHALTSTTYPNDLTYRQACELADKVHALYDPIRALPPEEVPAALKPLLALLPVSMLLRSCVRAMFKMQQWLEQDIGEIDPQLRIPGKAVTDLFVAVQAANDPHDPRAMRIFASQSKPGLENMERTMDQRRQELQRLVDALPQTLTVAECMQLVRRIRRQVPSHETLSTELTADARIFLDGENQDLIKTFEALLPHLFMPEALASEVTFQNLAETVATAEAGGGIRVEKEHIIELCDAQLSPEKLLTLAERCEQESTPIDRDMASFIRSDVMAMRAHLGRLPPLVELPEAVHVATLLVQTWICARRMSRGRLPGEFWGNLHRDPAAAYAGLIGRIEQLYAPDVPAAVDLATAEHVSLSAGKSREVTFDACIDILLEEAINVSFIRGSEESVGEQDATPQVASSGEFTTIEILEADLRADIESLVPSCPITHWDQLQPLVERMCKGDFIVGNYPDLDRRSLWVCRRFIDRVSRECDLQGTPPHIDADPLVTPIRLPISHYAKTAEIVWGQNTVSPQAEAALNRALDAAGVRPQFDAAIATCLHTMQQHMERLSSTFGIGTYRMVRLRCLEAVDVLEATLRSLGVPDAIGVAERARTVIETVSQTVSLWFREREREYCGGASQSFVLQQLMIANQIADAEGTPTTGALQADVQWSQETHQGFEDILTNAVQRLCPREIRKYSDLRELQYWLVGRIAAVNVVPFTQGAQNLSLEANMKEFESVFRSLRLVIADEGGDTLVDGMESVFRSPELILALEERASEGSRAWIDRNVMVEEAIKALSRAVDRLYTKRGRRRAEQIECPRLTMTDYLSQAAEQIRLFARQYCPPQIGTRAPVYGFISFLTELTHQAQFWLVGGGCSRDEAEDIVVNRFMRVEEFRDKFLAQLDPWKGIEPDPSADRAVEDDPKGVVGLPAVIREPSMMEHLQGVWAEFDRRTAAEIFGWQQRMRRVVITLRTEFLEGCRELESECLVNDAERQTASVQVGQLFACLGTCLEQAVMEVCSSAAPQPPSLPLLTSRLAGVVAAFSVSDLGLPPFLENLVDRTVMTPLFDHFSDRADPTDFMRRFDNVVLPEQPDTDAAFVLPIPTQEERESDSERLDRGIRILQGHITTTLLANAMTTVQRRKANGGNRYLVASTEFSAAWVPVIHEATGTAIRQYVERFPRKRESIEEYLKHLAGRATTLFQRSGVEAEARLKALRPAPRPELCVSMRSIPPASVELRGDPRTLSELASDVSVSLLGGRSSGESLFSGEAAILRQWLTTVLVPGDIGPQLRMRGDALRELAIRFDEEFHAGFSFRRIDDGRGLIPLALPIAEQTQAGQGQDEAAQAHEAVLLRELPREIGDLRTLNSENEAWLAPARTKRGADVLGLAFVFHWHRHACEYVERCDIQGVPMPGFDQAWAFAQHVRDVRQRGIITISGAAAGADGDVSAGRGVKIAQHSRKIPAFLRVVSQRDAGAAALGGAANAADIPLVVRDLVGQLLLLGKAVEAGTDALAPAQEQRRETEDLVRRLEGLRGEQREWSQHAAVDPSPASVDREQLKTVAAGLLTRVISVVSGNARHISVCQQAFVAAEAGNAAAVKALTDYLGQGQRGQDQKVIQGLSAKVIEAEGLRLQAETAYEESQLLVDTSELGVFEQTLQQALRHLTGSADAPTMPPCVAGALEAAAEVLRGEVGAWEDAYLQYLDHEQGIEKQRQARTEFSRLEAAIAVDEAELLRLQALEQKTGALSSEADAARGTLARIASLLGIPPPDRA